MKRTTGLGLLLVLLLTPACRRQPSTPRAADTPPAPEVVKDDSLATATSSRGPVSDVPDPREPGPEPDRPAPVPTPGVAATAAEPVELVAAGRPALRAVWDFGTLAPGAEARHRFTITNRSAEPWTIRFVSSSCTCTMGAFSAQTVRPSETTWVELTFRAPAKEGPVLQSIAVDFAGPAAPKALLEVRGQVYNPFSVAPLSLDFGHVPTGARPSRKVELKNRGDRDLTITKVEAPDWFEVEVVPMSPSGQKDGPRQAWEVVIRADAAKLKAGSEVSTLVVRVSPEAAGPVLIPVRLQRKPPLEAVPDFLDFERVEAGKSGQKTFFLDVDPALAGLSEKDLVATHDLGDELEVRITKTGRPDRFMVVGVFRPAQAKGPVKGTLEIKARQGNDAPARVRVYANVP